MAIKLPIEKRTKALRINPRITLIYSAPKIGKSELSALLPNSLLIDLEKGSDFAKEGMFIKVNDLKKLYEVGEAIKEAGRPYKYVIIDPITTLENWCEAHATESYKATSLGSTFKGQSILELAHGGGYYWWRQSYGLWFNYCCTLAEHIILLAHVKDKMLVDATGKELRAHGIASQDLDLTGKLKAITCARADAIGYLYRRITGASEGKSLEEIRINFHGGESLVGARAKHLSGKDIFLSAVVDPEKEEIIAHWENIFLSETK